MERTDLTQGIRDRGSSLSPDYKANEHYEPILLLRIISALEELWAGAAMQGAGAAWLWHWLGLLCPGRGGQGRAGAALEPTQTLLWHSHR